MSYGHDFTHHCVCFICMTVLYYLCSIDGKTSVFQIDNCEILSRYTAVELSIHIQS